MTASDLALASLVALRPDRIGTTCPAWIESAVARVLDEGWRTRDIADVNTPADKILGTTTMGDKVVAAL